ncbi:hypothetical protein AKO1_005134 [Acrasis kona]|uniref:Uncharacterized protein n=1 Tax=Acrasis kona TaxID=1008807 RepID=A0AAW2Z3T7_9EUKA
MSLRTLTLTIDPDVTLLINSKFSCDEYFCSIDGESSRLNLQTTLQRTFGQSVNTSDSALITKHNFLRNFCYHCQHGSRVTFQQRLESNSSQCPYFWAHQKDYCGPTKTITILGEDMSRVEKFKNWAVQQDPKTLGTSLSVNNFTDIIALTVWRSARPDASSLEVNRGEFSYMCYCTSSQKFGMQCDGYTSFLIPFRYLVDPFIVLFSRIITAAFMIYFVYIPLLVHDFKKQYRTKGFVKFVFNHLLDLKTSAILYMIIGMLIGGFDEIITLIIDDNYGGQKYYTIFTGIQCIFTGMSFGTLLVLWINLVDNANNMVAQKRLSMKCKIILVLCYIMVVFTVIALIVVFSLVEHHRFVAFVLDTMMSGSLAFLFTIFSIGFTIYGTRMYKVISSTSNIKPWKLKFIKFMMAAVLVFLVFSLWLVVVSVQTVTGNLLGLFITLFVLHICSWIMTVMSFVISFLLFDKEKFLAAQTYLHLFKRKKALNNQELGYKLLTEDGL